jgi:hypothetical protein
MRLTIIPGDKYIAIDNNGLLNIQQDLNWIPSNVHALQWYDTWGEVEYNDETPNERIENLGIFEQAVADFNNEKKILQDELDAIEAARDYWEELRVLRNQRLSDCDWTQMSDVPFTEEQKISWKNYRQLLRDLPESITDPKQLVVNPTDSNWPIKPTY